ncbi:hypothetical protein KXJ74_08120 [Acinetobacter johnsonii]|nr:hypothetical protein KXJ74_08120 [Acinetobacter johnsonii]
MKLNISFDWAIVTSLFTFLLYWCGYCSYIGYLNFYGFNIDSFDIPLVSMIIQGFIHGYKAWLALIIIFILMSYITSISLNQWRYWAIKGLALTINFLIIIYHLTLSYPINYISQQSLVSKAIQLTADKTPNLVKFLLIGVWDFLKTVGLKIRNKSNKIEESNHQILDHLRLTTPQIKQEIYGDNQESSINQNFTFDLSFFIHNSVLLLLLAGIINVLNIGQHLIDDGKKRASSDFNSTLISIKNEKYSQDKYPLVEVKGQDTDQKLFLTNICLKSMCLVTDTNRNAQIYDVKDLKVLH